MVGTLKSASCVDPAPIIITPREHGVHPQCLWTHIPKLKSIPNLPSSGATRPHVQRAFHQHYAQGQYATWKNCSWFFPKYGSGKNTVGWIKSIGIPVFKKDSLIVCSDHRNQLNSGYAKGCCVCCFPQNKNRTRSNPWGTNEVLAWSRLH